MKITYAKIKALLAALKPELRHVAAGAGAAAAAAVPLLISSHGHLTQGDLETLGVAFITGVGLGAYVRQKG